MWIVRVKKDHKLKNNKYIMNVVTDGGTLKCMSFLTKAICDKIRDWKCPNCFIFEKKIREKLIIKEDEENCEVKIKNKIWKEITNFLPEIIIKIEKTFKNVFFFFFFFFFTQKKEIDKTWAYIVRKEKKKESVKV